jgi:hypothetical protein
MCSDSQIVRFEARVLGDTRKHSWTDFLVVMKREDVVGKSDPFKCPVRAPFTFDRPSQFAVALPELVWPSQKASGSWLNGEDLAHFGNALAMLKSVCQNTKRKRLGRVDGFVASRTVRKNARQIEDLGHPSAVIFTFHFESQHDKNPYSPRPISGAIWWAIGGRA